MEENSRRAVVTVGHTGRKNRDMILFVCISAGIVLFDQVTKMIARNTLSSGDRILIPGVLRLMLVQNTGAAFGSFSGRTAALAAFTVALMALCAWAYWRTAGRTGVRVLKVTLVMIFAGGLGNFIDRAFLGSVTDFIFFETIDFPVFNVADCFVTVGALTLLISAFTVYREKEMRELLGFPKKREAEED